jgi:hypothetical protein
MSAASPDSQVASVRREDSTTAEGDLARIAQAARLAVAPGGWREPVDYRPREPSGTTISYTSALRLKM